MLRRIIYKIIIKYLKPLPFYKDIILKDRNYTDAYLNSGVLYMEMDSLQKAKESFDLMAKGCSYKLYGIFYVGSRVEKLGQKDIAFTKLSVCVPFKRRR